MKLLLSRANRTIFLISLLAISTSLVPLSATTVATQQKPPANTQVTSPTASNTVKFIVTVTTERGTFISGLSQDSFAVFEGKSQHEINHFSEDDSPVSVGILVDVSESVRPQTIEIAKHAMAQFVQQSHPENEYFVAEFDSISRGVTDWTQDMPTIAEGLNRLGARNSTQQKPKPQGQTALYDTCFAALKKVMEGKHTKRVLLVLSDGQDNNSSHTFNQLRQIITDVTQKKWQFTLDTENIRL